MLSGPPDTATAISGRGSNPPIAVSAASSAARVSGTGSHRDIVTSSPGLDPEVHVLIILLDGVKGRRGWPGQPGQRQIGAAQGGLGSTASKPLSLTVGGLLDRGARIRKSLVELRQRQAGVLLLVGFGQRPAEIEEIFRGLRSLGKTPVTLGEGGRRLLVFVAGVIAVSYTHLRAHETGRNLVCRLL